MRDRKSYIAPVKLGEVFRAATVGEVIQSLHSKFKPGDIVHVTNVYIFS